MTEATLQAKFSAWCKHHWNTSSAIELKLVKGTRMPYMQVKEHQQYALWRAKHARLIHKLSDSAIGFLPFDMFVLVKSDAFVGICFYKKNRKLQLLLIDIDDFLEAKTTRPRKSLTEQEAYALAKHIVTL